MQARTDGLLLVDKPAGITSHDVVQIARKAYDERSIGHLGTLDPFATGLLVLLLGRYTRLATFIETDPKVYDAWIRFGTETATDDSTGATTREAPVPSPTEVEAAIPALTGRIAQVPPDYSAKSVGGRRAHEAARAGEPLLLGAVEVDVFGWTIRERRGDELHVTIECGSGTYIRSLARDLGRATSSAAHLTSLRRLRSGEFDVDSALTIEELQASPPPLRKLRVIVDDA